MSLFLTWFGVMFPLVFSPGPANIAFAATGSQVGLKKSIPFLIGIDLVFIIKSIIIGFGLGEIVQAYPFLMIALQLIGAGYLVYLAVKFVIANSVTSKISDKALGFKDGVILQILNSKGWIMVFLMFSLFTAQAQSIFAGYSIVILIIWLAILNISLHIVWIVMGNFLAKISSSPSYQKLLNYGYAICLIGVAIWLIIDNPIWSYSAISLSG